MFHSPGNCHLHLSLCKCLDIFKIFQESYSAFNTGLQCVQKCLDVKLLKHIRYLNHLSIKYYLQAPSKRIQSSSQRPSTYQVPSDTIYLLQRLLDVHFLSLSKFNYQVVVLSYGSLPFPGILLVYSYCASVFSISSYPLQAFLV